MKDDPISQRRRALAAIRRSARVARSRGVAVIPLKESREHLAILFEDPAEINRVVAAYDHLEDAIVFNADNTAWSDMGRFMKDLKIFYSTDHPQHIVRHELGHAAHYRTLSSQERSRIWFAESLAPEELPIAGRVSGRAVWSPKEFVAEAFAGLWDSVDYDEEVLRSYPGRPRFPRVFP